MYFVYNIFFSYDKPTDSEMRKQEQNKNLCDHFQMKLGRKKESENKVIIK
jgi:hypothetical protein